MNNKNRLGILVGGGPAPGINGVISSATIEAVNSGMDVIGIYDGFKWLMENDISKTTRLTIQDVSRIHTMGGSILRTSRDGPFFDEEGLQNIINSLKQLGITHLITIGGDGTGSSASKLADKLNGEIKLAHVPKTIDNDLPLPIGLSTFGFQTARHVGTSTVQNLMEDAKTTGRWYVVVTMGREAGFLALGTCFAAGATLAIIPEEFPDGICKIRHICDILEGAVFKRYFMGRNHGVAVLAEGLGKCLEKDEIDESKIERDTNSRLRLSDINIGKLITDTLKRRFSDRGQGLKIVHKFIGHELRSCDPIPFDIDYTRRLGYGAVRCLLKGEHKVMICYQGAIMHTIKLDEITDKSTGFIRTRQVDINSEYYRVAYDYMIRLKSSDFTDNITLEGISKAAGMLPEQFESRYRYLVNDQ